MNTSHDQKWSSLVALMVLFMVMCAARPVIAEQPLIKDVSPCVNIRSAIERLTCYDEARQPLTIDVSLCVNNKSAIERLTCYDELVDQAQQTLGQKSVEAGASIQDSPKIKQAPVIEQRVTQDGRVTEENFGLPPEKQEDTNELVELHSTISKLKEYVPSRYLITLENGQVWRQMVGEKYALKVGYKVRIYPSRWGKSFRLSAEGVKGFIQVERVR